MKCFWLECPSLFIEVDHFALQERRLSNLYGEPRRRVNLYRIAHVDRLYLSGNGDRDPETASAATPAPSRPHRDPTTVLPFKTGSEPKNRPNLKGPVLIGASSFPATGTRLPLRRPSSQTGRRNLRSNTQVHLHTSQLTGEASPRSRHSRSIQLALSS